MVFCVLILVCLLVFSLYFVVIVDVCLRVRVFVVVEFSVLGLGLRDCCVVGFCLIWFG